MNVFTTTDSTLPWPPSRSPSSSRLDRPGTARLETGHQSSRCDAGQTTAEYALVLLAAGSIAMMVVAWANGTGAIGDLFDAMLSRITSLAT